MTPVLFRKSGDGEITAVFPTLPGSPGYMTCYAHIGQHSSCSHVWLDCTARATEQEYAPLLRELQAIGYDDLRVYARRARWMERQRRANER